MKKSKIVPLPLKDITINGSFWKRYIELVRGKVIPYQWEALNDRIPEAAKSHSVKNFEIAAGRSTDEFYGMCFQDSDLYKWIESVAYSLEAYPDPKLEALADGVIELIGAAQCEDGYVNTYYTVKYPERRWANLQHGHELYCAGHLIEAAAAYHAATGKSEFLKVAIKFADCIDNFFGAEEGKLNGYPGHQEIELALYKLYEVTGEKRYLNLAGYFIKQRGKKPNYFDMESEKPEYVEIFREVTLMGRDYSQSHIPPAEQRVATGHAVRAVYMYSAMADLAWELDDTELHTACAALYEDIVTKQMYLTGAIGAAAYGERFTSAYDLPNDAIYGETCASVGLMMFARRMNAIHKHADFIDTCELALYNTVLAGISLAGTEFFYVNPLETEPKKIPHNPSLAHVKPVRQKWFDCACCPSNLARAVMSLGHYSYGKTDDSLYINLYVEGCAKDGGRKVEVTTAYPFGDEAKVKVSGGRYKLVLRNPKAAPVLKLSINGKEEAIRTDNGYITLERDWQGDVVALQFDMKPKLVYSAGEVQQNAGKAAVMRGPIVYCVEEVDNDALLGSYALKDGSDICLIPPPNGLLPESAALTTEAYKYQYKSGSLYTTEKPALVPCEVTLIPYFQWANRGENEMRVFLRVRS